MIFPKLRMKFRPAFQLSSERLAVKQEERNCCPYSRSRIFRGESVKISELEKFFSVLLLAALAHVRLSN